jgi:carbamoyl-phosphate synthase large subunit
MIIGAGPIIIGQACEFDYSGAQACKALREEGYRVILVNSNPATIMTDPEMADATYIEPITPEVVARSSRRNAPTRSAHDGRADRAQHRAGAGRYGRAGEVRRRDDRRQARSHRDGRGPQAVPRGDGPARHGEPRRPSPTTWKNVAGALALEEIGLPAIIRPAFTLGGTGGGVAYNRDDYEKICRGGLDASPVSQILIDESLLGWKEFEMEVVRDKADNAIIVCSIENVDPMGVHTGDSITVAPR